MGYRRPDRNKKAFARAPDDPTAQHAARPLISPGSRQWRLAIVLGGIVLGQSLLYGPSLIGRKILLPLDVLAGPNVYLPHAQGTDQSRTQSAHLSDITFLAEPERRFAVSELRAGRLPAWTPYRFAGAPVMLPRLSPFVLLQCCTESPVILAWAQLLVAAVAGLGAYSFSRRVLRLSFWPGAVAAWCYPLTGFFVLWQGYSTSLPVAWLPWLLLAVDGTVRSAESRVQTAQEGSAPAHPVACEAPIWLSLATCLVLVSGQLDVAGQVLLISALYALWRLWEFRRLVRSDTRLSPHGSGSVRPPRSNPKMGPAAPGTSVRISAIWARAAVTLLGGWALGVFLAAPYVLPVLDYGRTGARLAQRAGGAEERPPAGWSALPKLVLPELHGGMSGDTVSWGGEIEVESAAAGYAGAVATLVLAPLAWRSRRHRSLNLFWVFLAFVGMSWCLNVPGMVQLLRLPGLNMMSHNRLVFAAAFALVALMATGVEALLQHQAGRRWWYWLPVLILAGLCAWSVAWARSLPEPIATQFVAQIKREIAEGKLTSWVHDLEGVRRVHAWFRLHYAAAGCWCGIGVATWLLLWFRSAWQRRLFPALVVVLLGELLWCGRGRIVQADPALYYPRVPVLEEIARSAPGRVIGAGCLPANLAQVCRLRDVRGYDAVEPKEFLELLDLARDPQSRAHVYARSQWMAPAATITSEGVFGFSPILDLLGVRYVIIREPPPAQTRPAFQGQDYWVLTNAMALPRAFVPRRVEVAADPQSRLAKLGSPAFAPREVAYVERAVPVPELCRGTAEVLAETPARVALELHMDTAGLVVLADRWDQGWKAYLNGKQVEILKANHAVRAVVAPAGQGTLEFRYAPASLAWGLALSAVAAVVLAGRGLWVLRSTRRPDTSPEPEGQSQARRGCAAANKR